MNTEEITSSCLIVGEVFTLPKDHVLKDENGNVINATKIVLEKKKDVSLTQEQINTMVHDSCVLFCKHYGCGIPRETCTSLGTCKEHDEYRTAIGTHLMEKKKKEYPKTYEECSLINGAEGRISLGIIGKFTKLINARNAYWKLYGEEMGLGKPWEPDWKKQDKKYIISVFEDTVIYFENETYNRNTILAFPTEEMRDAFYENFKELIEECKELL